MDFSKIDLTPYILFIPSLIMAIISLGAAWVKWRELPLELEKQRQKLQADKKLDEVELATKVEQLYSKLQAVRDLEINSLRQQNIDCIANLDLLRKQVADLQTQLRDEREEHHCEMQLMREGYELRIGQMQKRIEELEAEVIKLKGGVVVP